MNAMFGLLGLSGGVLCAIGDLFLDLKGKDNQKLGKLGLIDSSWAHMAPWRFRVSLLLAAAGVPLYFLGLTSLASQLAEQSRGFGLFFWIVSLIGSIGGFFIHAMTCLVPIIDQTLRKKGAGALVEELVEQIFTAIRLPFYVMYTLLVGLTSLLLAYAFYANYLKISPLFLLLTPLALLIVGVSLRRLKPRLFFDLPGIVMPSLGLGMLGLMSALNAVA